MECSVATKKNRRDISPTAGIDADPVVSAIYEAALDRSRWCAALEMLRDRAGAWGAQLIAIDQRVGAIAFSCTAGIPTDAELEYVRRYCALDPRVGFVLGNDEHDAWMFDHELLSDEFVAGDRFYQELIIPAGLRYIAGAKVYADAEVSVILALFRALGQAPLSREETGRLSQFLPHLRRAIALSIQNFRFSTQALVGLEIVNRLKYPVFLIGGQRRIIHANEAGRRALQAGAPLREESDRLTASGTRAARLLREVLDEMAAAQTQGVVQQTRVLSLERDDGRPLKGFLMPLLPKAVMGVFGPTPLIMAAFSDHGSGSLPAASFVMAAYDLTPAEAQVALGIAKGMRPAEVAKALGRGHATVKSQIKSIFSKMGVRSQSAMVSELLSLPNLEDGNADGGARAGRELASGFRERLPGYRPD